MTSPVLTIADDGVISIRTGPPCSTCWSLAAARPGSMANGCTTEHPLAIIRHTGDLVILMTGDPYGDRAERELVGMALSGRKPSEEAVRRVRHLWRHPRRWGVQDPADERQVLVALTFALDRRFNRWQAKRWVRAGVPATTAFWWRDAQRSPAQARDWLAVGANEPRDEHKWERRGLSIEDARAWKAEGFDATDAWPWIERGATAQQARDFIILDAWDFALRVRAPGDPQWGALVTCAAQHFVISGQNAGRTPEQVRALAEAMVPSAQERTTLRIKAARQDQPRRGRRWQSAGVWPRKADLKFTKVAGTLADLDWVEVGVCVQAGMSVAEAAAYLRSGGDMEPVAVMAALNH